MRIERSSLFVSEPGRHYDDGYIHVIRGFGLRNLPNECICHRDRNAALHADIANISAFKVTVVDDNTAILELIKGATWYEHYTFDYFASPYSTPRTLIDVVFY